MGHANGDMSGRYGKQLLDNVQWRRDCAAKVGLGFALPTEEEQPSVDKSGQVLKDERQEVVAAEGYMRAGKSGRANGFEPSTSWSRTSIQKSLSHRPGV